MSFYCVFKENLCNGRVTCAYCAIVCTCNSFYLVTEVYDDSFNNYNNLSIRGSHKMKNEQTLSKISFKRKKDFTSQDGISDEITRFLDFF